MLIVWFYWNVSTEFCEIFKYQIMSKRCSYFRI